MNQIEVEDLLSKVSPEELANMLNLPEQQGADLLSQSSPEIMRFVAEYARLASLQNRLDEDDDRLDALLEVAYHNEVLDFWITEVDHLLGHHLDLLNDDARESYQNQQALVREYLGLEIFPTPAEKPSSEKDVCPSDSENCCPEDDRVFH